MKGRVILPLPFLKYFCFILFANTFDPLLPRFVSSKLNRDSSPKIFKNGIETDKERALAILEGKNPDRLKLKQ